MSGIVNSTGAVSGLIGTTVGTPSAAAGSVLKVTYIGGSITTVSTSSGTHTVRTTNFTPQSATNNLYIEFQTSWQAYGNGAALPRSNFECFHNGVELNTSGTIGKYTSHGDENYFYTIKEFQASYYIPETHGSTTTGAMRIIYFRFTPTVGSHEMNQAYGEHTITIWEFA